MVHVPWTAPSVAAPFYGKATFLPYHVFIIRNSAKTLTTVEIWSVVYLRGKSLKVLSLDVLKKLKCTKIDLGWALPQKPTEQAYSALPDLLAGLNRTYGM